MRSISSIFPIYKLTLRSILRERVALSMLALLALVLILLPASLETDGTIQGALRMHIRYSLGFSTFLLAAMTLWVSCASIAGDLSSKRLHMLLTKPVTRGALWWGKWLAVVTLSTGLSLICGLVTYFRIQHMINTADLSTEAKGKVMSQQVTARRPVDPQWEDLGPEAKALAAQQIAAGAVPEGYPEEALLAQMESFLRVSRNAASAGEQVSWTFDLKKPLVLGEQLQLAYTYDGSAMGVSKSPGTWRISTPGASPSLVVHVDETPYAEKVISFEVTADMADAKQVLVSFENRGEEGGRVFFKTERGLRLFFEAGGFGLNIFRALLLISGLLAILAAIGVSTGSVFSLPVACYVTAVILLLQAFSGTVKDVVDAGIPPSSEEQTNIARAVEVFQFKVYEGVLVVLQPLQVESPLGRVAQGVFISPAELGRVFGLRFTPVILLISGLGIFIFSRREIGEAA